VANQQLARISVLKVARTGRGTQLLAAEIKDYFADLLVVIGLVVVFGILISSLVGELYKVYEGRKLWPLAIHEWGRKKQQRRVDRLEEAQKRLDPKREEDKAAYDETWYELRAYPTNAEGAPIAVRPTIMGNILQGYEDYPGTRYGMDSVFYWPRMWMEMEKGKKEEIDSTWSLADGFLSLSAVGYAGGVLWILAGTLAYLDILTLPLPWKNSGASVFGGIIALFLGYFFYRVSLPLHRDNGEAFKAVFDLYRHSIADKMGLRPGEKEKWYAIWAYFQYLYVRCVDCYEYNPLTSKRCKKCSADLAIALDRLLAPLAPAAPPSKPRE